MSLPVSKGSLVGDAEAVSGTGLDLDLPRPPPLLGEGPFSNFSGDSKPDICENLAASTNHKLSHIDLFVKRKKNSIRDARTPQPREIFSTP